MFLCSCYSFIIYLITSTTKKQTIYSQIKIKADTRKAATHRAPIPRRAVTHKGGIPHRAVIPRRGVIPRRAAIPRSLATPLKAIHPSLDTERDMVK